MRRFVTPLLFLAVACAALALAQSAGAAGYPLITGTYKTLLGTIEPGRATESMPYDFGEGIDGNMLNAESWNDPVLGGNWKVTCAQKSGPAVLISDVMLGNMRQMTYVTPYSGGLIWLSGTGAWAAGGAPYYEGVLTSFTVTAVKQYVGGQLVRVVSNINFVGEFPGPVGTAPQCFAMDISNAQLIGMTGGAPVGLPPPAGTWPVFLGPLDCGLVGAHGTYWTVSDVTLSIIGDCATPTRVSTWGRVKSLYR
jgi:hypothetical protein